MRGLGILCKGTGCDGCHCHLSAPCAHCVERLIEGPPSRVFKSTGSPWRGPGGDL